MTIQKHVKKADTVESLMAANGNHLQSLYTSELFCML